MTDQELKDLSIEDNNPQRKKFVDYFNERREEKFKEKGHFKYENRFDNVHIISKKMGFIKWLVEKDKIEREKFGNSETKSSKYSDFELSYDTPREDYKNILLMELAIQDDPITFILKILK